MQEIIAPIDKDLLKSELTKDRFIRYTNNGNNEIYLINYKNAPNVVREIGRLREVTFREAGGGTGLSIDLDDHDTAENCYDQLIAWNPVDEEVVASYRVIKCVDARMINGIPNLSTAHYFEFSEDFLKNYLPYTIELGRSFVQPKYQPAIDNRKGIFSLDNLWDGLGALVMMNPEIKYLFGKVTMYPSYPKDARDMLLYFMEYYFPDKDHLVSPLSHLEIKNDDQRFIGMFDGLEYKDGYKVLNSKIREMGENIPPLINTYMKLSPSMKSFGTARNDEFGTVEETGILITIADVYPNKKERHMLTYDRDKNYDEKPAK